MKLSIIVVNYNGKQFFDECFASINKFVRFEHEVIVVDNSSTDGSAEYLTRHYPDVTLIESKKNLGFSHGNNLGVLFAVGDYILLLNNDTVLLSPLIEAILLFEKDCNVGLVSIKMLSSTNEYRYSSGYFPSMLRLIKFSSLYKKDGPFKNGSFSAEPSKKYEVDWVEGSFMLLSRSLWKNVGGMDNDYFMYTEDIDLCWKIKDHGYKIVLYPSLSYQHFGGYDETRLNLIVAGFVKFHRKHSSYLYCIGVNAVLLSSLSIKIVVNTCLALLDQRELYRKNTVYWSAIKEVLQ